jgi:hypothetical protein
MPRPSVGFEKIAARISPYFRAKRMRKFLAIFSVSAETTIVDVGGYPAFWYDFPRSARITVVNNYRPSLRSNLGGYDAVIADGRDLPFTEQAFDIAFSNSVIEHLATYDNQKRYAAEMRRVATSLWVQTPARSFPIETHLKSPFIHYLPARWQRRLIRHFTVWGWMSKPTREDIDGFVGEVRLLSYREMKELFADCRIIRERFLFFTKSYIAVRTA